MTKVLVVNLLNNELFPTPYSPIKMTFCSGTFTDAIVNKMAYYNFLNAHDNLNFNQTSARPQSSKFQKIVSTGDFSVTLSVKSVSCVYIVSLLEGREIWTKKVWYQCFWVGLVLPTLNLFYKHHCKWRHSQQIFKLSSRCLKLVLIFFKKLDSWCLILLRST